MSYIQLFLFQMKPLRAFRALLAWSLIEMVGIVLLMLKFVLLIVAVAQIRLPALLAKFDEIRSSGQLLPTALQSIEGKNQERNSNILILWH